MSKEKGFIPDWTEKVPAEGTYRSIFKWGAPAEFKHPSDAWYRMMKEEFGMTDGDFKARKEEGLEMVSLKRKVRIGGADIRKFESIAGKRECFDRRLQPAPVQPRQDR